MPLSTIKPTFDAASIFVKFVQPIQFLVPVPRLGVTLCVNHVILHGFPPIYHQSQAPSSMSSLTRSIETGMRLGELLSLQWADVGEKAVLLRGTKNGDDRKVPLSNLARSLIGDRRDIDPQLVFTLNAKQASKAFQRASVNGVHFHDSRSEAVTRMSKKLDVMQLSRVIGHRDLKSLMHYYSESAESIADKLA